MCTDLVFNSAFTLPGEGATLTQLEYALAILAGLKFKETVDGRHVFERFDAKNLQELRYVIPRLDDPRSDSSAMAEILKELGGFSSWMPLTNGKHTGLVYPERNILPMTRTDNGALCGKWKITFPQSYTDHNRPQNNINLPIVQVGEEYTGYNLLEVVCRGVLAHAGRYKDVFLYFDDKGGNWQHIALNSQQLFKLNKGDWERFHRRFIWFPSLNKYAYLMDSSTGLPADVWEAKTALARKEVEDRKKWTKSEDLRDYLDNYRYKGKGVFDNNRLPRGELL